jgi:hypothetical protein
MTAVDDDGFTAFAELYAGTLFAMWRQLKDHHAPLAQYLEFERFMRIVYAHS